MLFGFVSYILLHLGLYVLLFRHLDLLKQERAIFLYHAVPALGLTVFALLTVLAGAAADRLAQALLLISLQGIYSLSFLELWSLTEGGYSLSILSYFESARRAGRQPDLADLEHIGAGKKTNRLASLQRLSLLQPTGRGFRLTWRGRIVSAALHVLCSLANLENVG
jgi:hypothetical protein